MASSSLAPLAEDQAMVAPVASSSAVSTGIEHRILAIEGDINRIDSKIEQKETEIDALKNATADVDKQFRLALQQEKAALIQKAAALQEEKNLLLKERAVATAALAGTAAASGGQSQSKKRLDSLLQ
jgi:cell division protein FtsL